MADYSGTIFADTQNGSDADETFDFSQGGSDTLNGGAGFDEFDMGAELDADDMIDGGADLDTVSITGVYASPLVFKASTIANIEALAIATTGPTFVKLAEGNIAGGHMMNVSLNAADVTVDASALTTGAVQFLFGQGGERLIGGHNDDRYVAYNMDRTSVLDGQDGHDEVWMANGATMHAADRTFHNIEELRLDGASNLVLADGNCAAGETLGVLLTTASGVSMTVDGHKEADGHLSMLGYLSDDRFTGGRLSDMLNGYVGDDTLKGGGGADDLTGGDGADWFVFSHVRDSWKGGFDVIQDLDNTDRIQLSAIDADKTQGGVQHFTLVEAFDGHAGELTLSYDAEANVTWVLGDVDGDGRAELRIEIAGDHSDFTGLVLGGGA